MMVKVNRKVSVKALATRAALVATSLITFHALASAQVSKEALLKKAETSVIQKAMIGTPQKVVVTFDIDAERLEAAERVRSRIAALKMSPDKTLISRSDDWQSARQLTVEEETTAINGLMAKVFPGGQFGRAKLIETFTLLGQAYVEVDDSDTLLALLALDKVRFISQVPTVGPAGTSHLNFIGQPATAGAGKTGQETRVVVIDDYLVDPNSSDLAGRILGAWEWTEAGQMQPLCSEYSCGGTGTSHGQNVSSIVAQVAPSTKITFFFEALRTTMVEVVLMPLGLFNGLYKIAARSRESLLLT